MSTKKRITPAEVHAQIAHIETIRLPEGRTFVCEVVMKNGHTVHGTATVQRIEDDVPDTGRQMAFESAFEKAYECVIYAQREKEMLEAEAAA